MAVLRSCSALEAYSKLYVGQIAPWKVAEFLIPPRLFPEGVAALRSPGGLRAASHQRRTGRSFFQRGPERLSGKLRSDLDYTRIGEIFQIGLHEHLHRLQTRLGEISAATERVRTAKSSTRSRRVRVKARAGAVRKARTRVRRRASVECLSKMLLFEPRQGRQSLARGMSPGKESPPLKSPGRDVRKGAPVDRLGEGTSVVTLTRKRGGWRPSPSSRRDKLQPILCRAR